MPAPFDPRRFASSCEAHPSLHSGCWESNPVYTLPKRAYYRYTTARYKFTFILSYKNIGPAPRARSVKPIVAPRLGNVKASLFPFARPTSLINDLLPGLSPGVSLFGMRIQNKRDFCGLSFLPCHSIYILTRASFKPTVDEKYPTLQMPSFSI